MKDQRTFPRKKDRAKKRRLRAELKRLAINAGDWQQKALVALRGISAKLDGMNARLERMNQRYTDQELSDKAGNWAIQAQSLTPN